jgi:hypothetical protein
MTGLKPHTVEEITTSPVVTLPALMTIEDALHLTGEKKIHIDGGARLGTGLNERPNTRPLYNSAILKTGRNGGVLLLIRSYQHACTTVVISSRLHRSFGCSAADCRLGARRCAMMTFP